MNLSRNQLLAAGMIVIILFYFLYKIDVLRQSSITDGHVIAFKRNELLESSVYYPVISFRVESGIIAFWGDSTRTDLSIGDEVKVLYRINDPQRAELYSFADFWFGQVVYCIVPVAVWAAFVLSFIDKGGKTKLRLKILERKGKEEGNPDLPEKR